MKPFPASFTRIKLAFILSLLTAYSVVKAATYRWDFDSDPTIGTPAVATPGSGTWSTSAVTWNNASSPATDTVWTDGNAVQFGGGGGAAGNYSITVDPSVTYLTPTGGAAALTFTNSGFTLSAVSAVNIAVNGAITIAPTVTATIGSNLTLSAVSQLNIGTSLATGTAQLIIENGGKVSGGSGDFSLNTQTKIVVNSGGTLEAGRILVTGTEAPELVINGGAVNFTGATIFIAHTDASNGHITLNNGTLTGNSATASNGYLQFGATSGAANSSGTFDLNGGTLTVSQIKKGGTTGTVSATFNFNGGTLKVKTATTVASTFMTGLTTANVRNGGAVIDTNGVSITIGQALIHSTLDGDNAIDGGLTKLGAGTLTLTGANTFNGHISIQAGTLSLNSAFIGDTANVYFLTGAVLSLASGTDTIAGLFFNGTEQAIGTWGAVGSGATNQSAFFAGSGILNVTGAVIPEPSAYAVLAGVSVLGLVMIRRRRRR